MCEAPAVSFHMWSSVTSNTLSVWWYQTLQETVQGPAVRRQALWQANNAQTTENTIECWVNDCRSQWLRFIFWCVWFQRGSYGDHSYQWWICLQPRTLLKLLWLAFSKTDKWVNQNGFCSFFQALQPLNFFLFFLHVRACFSPSCH